MTSNRPSGRSSSGSGTPPTTRRSARQQRLANRQANRALARAGTRGGNDSGGSLMLYTVVALVIAAAVIGGALYLSGQSKAKQPLGSPYAPVGSALTPASIPTNGKTLGNADAKHTIDLYEDFQCPVCRDFTADTEPQIVATYVQTGLAKLVFHDYLVIDNNTGGTESLDAANAATCAADQGKFWVMHDWLYANQYGEGSGAFTKDRLKAIGKQVGLPDLARFNTCVDSDTHDADVQAEKAPAGVTATPTMIIDGGSPFAPGDFTSASTALNKAFGISPSPSVSASPSSSPTPTPTPTATPATKP
jgi:protein-disulfide isomerase